MSAASAPAAAAAAPVPLCKTIALDLNAQFKFFLKANSIAGGVMNTRLVGTTQLKPAKCLAVPEIKELIKTWRERKNKNCLFCVVKSDSGGKEVDFVCYYHDNGKPTYHKGGWQFSFNFHVPVAGNGTDLGLDA